MTWLSRFILWSGIRSARGYLRSIGVPVITRDEMNLNFHGLGIAFITIGIAGLVILAFLP